MKFKIPTLSQKELFNPQIIPCLVLALRVRVDREVMTMKGHPELEPLNLFCWQ